MLHIQRQASLVGMHRHVLRSMVGEHTPHIGHHANSTDIDHQYHEPDDAFNEVAQDVGGDGVVECPHGEQGQNEEEADAEDQRDGHRPCQNPAGHLLFVVRLVCGSHDCRAVEALYP